MFLLTLTDACLGGQAALTVKHCNQPSLAEQRGGPEIKVNLLTGGKRADERVTGLRTAGLWSADDLKKMCAWLWLGRGLWYRASLVLAKAVMAVCPLRGKRVLALESILEPNFKMKPLRGVSSQLYFVSFSCSKDWANSTAMFTE